MTVSRYFRDGVDARLRYNEPSSSHWLVTVYKPATKTFNEYAYLGGVYRVQAR